ncbi:MAG: hypothetical protein IJG39_12320, partial [Synergistaceae bacterium]|nr:hypothetical protein [Synergistaceae bacterium]
MNVKSKKLKRCAVELFKVLSGHIDPKTRMCSMFMRELANELNYTIRTIQRHAKELERYGLLKRQYRKKSWNRNDKNIFILTGE